MRRSVFPCLLLLAACGGDQKVGSYNAAPVVSIQSPADGASFDEGTQVDFVGQVSDSGTRPEALVVQWLSDVDDLLSDTDPCDSTGLCTFSTASLTAGFNHVITLAATDEQGERTEYDITLTIVDLPEAPEILVLHPDDESTIEGEEFTFEVHVEDAQDAPEALTVTMESNLDGVFCQPAVDASGQAVCDQALATTGDHRLTFTVTDSSGLSTSDDVDFYVRPLSDIDDDGDGFSEDQGDCNDGDASVGPTATEYYNGRDDDCDGVIDNDTAGYDDDGDGQSEMDGDCDDADTSIYEGATEAYDAKDNDCDGTTDEDTEGYDDDGDGLAEIAGDCDDSDPTSRPGLSEVEDGNDNDCNGTIDEGTNAYDDDGDGYTENGGDCDDTVTAISPAATESCDGVDDDCDGSVDEQNATSCTTYYYDYDGDGYGSSSVAGRCYCSTSSYYTSLNNSDCYDYNSSANPIHTTYHSTTRGDSSYDYNCDGAESKKYSGGYSCTLTVGDCEPTGTGFYSSTPSCGSSGTMLDDDDDCDYDTSGWPWEWGCEVNGAASTAQSCL